jgi:uncharacterized protein (TIGR02594 family)
MFECFKSKPVKVITEKPWLDLAKTEIGTKEIKGKKHNPDILKYHQATTLKATDDETPWCSSFINWCFQACGASNGTKSAAARSWLNWGKKVDLAKAEVGDVVIFSRPGNSWSGHVGLYLNHDDNNIEVLGGNQSDAVSVAKYSISRLLGVRRHVA